MVGVDDSAARDLIDGIDAALGPWVVRSVTEMMTAWRGECPPPVAQAAARAASEARAATIPALAVLLEADIDEQRTTPLALVRAAVRWPTEVLAGAGVPEVERDPFAVRAFPADVYGLSPASLADLSPDLVEAGIVWGAAKAFEHKRRHAGS